MASPNETLIPVFDGDHLIYVTPPEYYARFNRPIGKVAVEAIVRNDDRADTYAI